MLKKYLLACFLLASSAIVFAHNSDAHQTPLRSWHLKHHHHFHASFLMMKNDTVVLENKNGILKTVPFAHLSNEDQLFVQGKMAQIAQLNQAIQAPTPPPMPAKPPIDHSFGFYFWGFALLALSLLAAVALLKKNKPVALAFILGGTIILCAFKTAITARLLGTDPVFMNSAFQPFQPNVSTHWDNTWFYVASKGIPTTHPMMTGITKWQQQVPIPQCYIGANAWQIPLNPVLAATPVPVNQQHFLRGAVAIAANGIPIFNPYTNTGVDAFLDGQLDQWGGHCGRADDYHYHIAPMFLDTQTVDILPIAFALDGFAVYASLEPDGTPMLPLDDNHGHFDATGVYHYHGTATAPYMIGKMVGQVTEDATMQIIPQAKASPVRPALTPLNGATITNCQPNTSTNGYTVTYTRNGQTYSVAYHWTAGGVYTFDFMAPTGTTTETYNGFTPCEVPTAVQDLPEKKWNFTVFPNPSSGQFSLLIQDLDASEVRNIMVFNANGALVGETSTGVEHLPKLTERGIYFVKIQYKNGGVSSRKIVVQ